MCPDTSIAVCNFDLRKSGQQYVRREWSVGPYRRSIDLPADVDARLANVTYDNGVLVVILPVTSRPASGRIRIPKVGTARGSLVRHWGSDLHPA